MKEPKMSVRGERSWFIIPALIIAAPFAVGAIWLLLDQLFAALR